VEWIVQSVKAIWLTQENSDTKRKEVAEKWTIQYNTNIKPEQIK